MEMCVPVVTIETHSSNIMIYIITYVVINFEPQCAFQSFKLNHQRSENCYVF